MSCLDICARVAGCPFSLLLLRLEDEHIWNRLSMIDIISLKETSPLIHVLGNSYLCRRLYAFFQRLSPNVRRFRDEMRRAGAVISGSAALSFIVPDPELWSPNDVDMYVPLGAGLEFGKSLVFEGYCRVENIRDSTDTSVYAIDLRQPHLHINQVVTYRHAISGLKIDLIESTHWSPLAPISDFHLTVVMNYITADLVVSLYPSLTFNGKAVALNVWDDSLKHTSCMNKYVERGYDILKAFPEPMPPRTLRGYPFNGDSGSLSWDSRVSGDGYIATSMREYEADASTVDRQGQVRLRKRPTTWRRPLQTTVALVPADEDPHESLVGIGQETTAEIRKRTAVADSVDESDSSDSEKSYDGLVASKSEPAGKRRRRD